VPGHPVPLELVETSPSLREFSEERLSS